MKTKARMTRKADEEPASPRGGGELTTAGKGTAERI